MGRKLLITIVMLASTVSFAQHERYQQQAPQYGRPAQVEQNEPEAGNDGYEEIETVENNLAQNSQNADGEVSQTDNYKGSNTSSNSDGSPQINIYNANSNANKLKNDSKASGSSEAQANADVEAEAGAGYIMRANDMRNARKSMEVGTEQKMIEKIEYSRMQDEKDRADRLFGNRLDKKNDYEQKEEYTKPPVVVVEKPVYETPKTEVPYATDEVKTETSYALWDQQSYIAPLLGMMSSSAGHVSSDLATGIAFGTHFATNFSVEASFLYSDLKMDNVVELIDGKEYEGFKSGEQYSFGMGVAYHFTNWGRVTPRIGGILAYTYRDFDQTRRYQASGSSTAVDAGVGIGADVQVSKNFSIGAELRWMSNLTYDRDNSELESVSRYGSRGYDRYGRDDYRSRSRGNNTVSPMEEASYQMFLINGKFNF